MDRSTERPYNTTPTLHVEIRITINWQSIKEKKQKQLLILLASLALGSELISKRDGSTVDHSLQHGKQYSCNSEACAGSDTHYRRPDSNRLQCNSHRLH